MTESPMRVLSIGALALMVIMLSSVAHAQYRNNSLALDISGGPTWSERSLVEDGALIDNPNQRGNPVSWQAQVGVTYNQKLGHDHWWLSVGFGMGFMATGATGSASDFGARASDGIGNTIGLESLMGVRYYLSTDRIRPYIQPAMSYTRLFYLVGDSDAPCNNAEDCPNGESKSVAYMPHPNIGSLLARVGLEWIVERNVALHLYTETAIWLLPNAKDPITQRGALGFTAFY